MELQTGQKVRVYWNLRKRCFSIQDYKTRKVIAHTEDAFILKDVEFKVYETGRQRVLKTGQKNVHSFVIGTVVEYGFNIDRRVTYNPFKYDSFVDAETFEPIKKAKYAGVVVEKKLHGSSVPVVLSSMNDDDLKRAQKLQELVGESDVHTSHCCPYCPCKYGDPHCTVNLKSGTKVPEFICEDCDDRFKICLTNEPK